MASDQRGWLRSPLRPRTLAIVGLAVLLGVIGGIHRLGCNRDPSRAAEGTIVSRHLGLTLELPAGWRHLPDEDRAYEEGYATRSSVYMHGGAWGKPDEALLVTVVDVPQLHGARATQVPDAELVSLASDFAEMAPASLEGATGELGGCRAVARDQRHVAECVGTMTLSSQTYTAKLHLWAAPPRLVLVLALARDATRLEDTAIIDAIR